MRSSVLAMAFGLSLVPQMVSAQPAIPRPVVVPVPAAVEAVRPVRVVRPSTFGHAKQWIVGGSTALSINGAHEANHGTEANGFAVGVTPKAGYFLNDTFVLGGRMNVGYNQASSVKRLNVAVGPTIAAHVPLNNSVSLLPEFSATYGYGVISGGGISNAMQDQQVVLRLELNGLIHLTPHVSAMISPLVEQTVMNKVQTRNVDNSERALGSLTRYGAQVGLLVWL